MCALCDSTEMREGIGKENRRMKAVNQKNTMLWWQKPMYKKSNLIKLLLVVVLQLLLLLFLYLTYSQQIVIKNKDIKQS